MKRLKCPICNLSPINQIANIPYNSDLIREYLDWKYEVVPDELFDLTYIVNKCSCGMLWQEEVLEEKKLIKLYGEFINPKLKCENKINAPKPTFYGEARQLGYISNRFNKPQKEIKVLDYGAGWGRWATMSSAFGLTTSVYEPSKEIQQYLESKNHNCVTSIDHKYDFINLEQVLEHVLDPIELLRTLYDGLNEGGILHIGVPDSREVLNGLKNNNWKVRPDKNLMPLEHINGFTHKTLIESTRKVGFKLDKQPSLLSHRYNKKTLLKGILSGVYMRYFGTRLYFKK